MEQICPKDLCCGCAACQDICPKSCISMEVDTDGFKYPIVDQSLCIDCKLCRKTCPGVELLEGEPSPRLYAAWAKDPIDRDKGSSGGIFGLLASDVISHSGIVYGAAFDEDLMLRHKRVTTREGITQLCKSKYIISDTTNIYKQVKNDCEQGITVLFCGTPCQCAALRKFLNRPYENLLLVDFLCHGVPSLDLWIKSITAYEQKNRLKITEFKFRAKPKKKIRYCDHYFDLTAINHKGQEIVKEGKPSRDFPYYYHYTTYCGFRQSCYDCQYANINRNTDITLADFWKLDKIINVNILDGYSALVINTPKGQSFIDRIDSKLNLIERPIDDLITYNPTYTKGTIITPRILKARSDLNMLSFQDYERKYMTAPSRNFFVRVFRFIKRKLKQ